MKLRFSRRREDSTEPGDYCDEFAAFVAQVLASLPAPLVREADLERVVAEVVAIRCRRLAFEALHLRRLRGGALES